MQKRTFLTNASVQSIDSPIPIRGLILINPTDQDCLVTADNGDTFPCPAFVIATWSLPPTLRVQAQMLKAPTNGEACNVIVTDEATLNTTSQLATLSGTAAVQIVPNTTLPGSPSDNEQAILWDNAANPSFIWLLQWNAALGRWIYLGGAEAIVNVDTAESNLFNGVWGDLATVGPSFTVPYAGDYAVRFMAQGGPTTSGGDRYQCGVALGATNPAKFWQANNGATTSITLMVNGEQKFTGLNQNQELRMRYNNGNATVTFANRVMTVHPIAIH